MITFFERLDMYLKYKGLNDNKLTVETGISNGLIGKARKRGSLSQENISLILCTYRELDANWLFTGEGEMIKSEIKNDELTIVDNNFLLDRLEKLAIDNYELKKEVEILKRKPYKNDDELLTAAEPKNQ